MSSSLTRRALGIGVLAGLAGCGGARDDGPGEIFGRIPDPSLPWNAPESMRAQADLPPSLRFPHHHDFAVSPDGLIIAATLAGLPTNEVLIIDIAAMRGWRLRHPYRRMLLTGPSFAPDGTLSLIVSPPPMYMGISELWMTSLRGEAVNCISGQMPYRYGKPHFSADGSRVLAFRDTQPGPELPGRRLRQYREKPDVLLFEIDLRTRAERQLSQAAFAEGEAFYAPDREGYYLSTSELLIPDRPAFEGAPIPYSWPSAMVVSRDDTYPFGGFFLPIGEEVPERPECIIPEELIMADGEPGMHARLEEVDRRGRLLIAYQHPHDDPGLRSSTSAALVERGLVQSRFQLDEARVQYARMSAEGEIVVGVLGARRVRGEILTQPNPPYIFAIWRNEALSFLAVDDVRFDRESIALQSHPNAKVVL